MYMSKLPNAIDADLIVSYADDTYVVITSNEWQTCTERANLTVEKHLDFLKVKGMVCNNSKTELMTLPENKNITIKVGNANVQSGSQLKALGLTFDHKLEWNHHVDNLVLRINKIVNGLRIIRRKFNSKQLSQIVTSQVFGVMYYGAATWLTPSLKSSLYKKLNRIHYAASRIIIGDWKCVISKKLIDQQTKRLPPKLWSNYNATSTIIKLMRNKHPSTLYTTIMSHVYQNRRHHNPVIMDSSKNRIGQKAISNWIGHPLQQVKEPWHELNLSDDRIRTMLKKTFYPQNYN